MSLSEHSLSPRLKPINRQQMVLRAVDVEQLIGPEAMRYHDSDQIVRVMEAEAVYVAVDEKTRRPIPIKN